MILLVQVERRVVANADGGLVLILILATRAHWRQRGLSFSAELIGVGFLCYQIRSTWRYCLCWLNARVARLQSCFRCQVSPRTTHVPSIQNIHLGKLQLWKPESTSTLLFIPQSSLELVRFLRHSAIDCSQTDWTQVVTLAIKFWLEFKVAPFQWFLDLVSDRVASKWIVCLQVEIEFDPNLNFNRSLSGSSVCCMLGNSTISLTSVARCSAGWSIRSALTMFGALGFQI